MRIHPSVFLLLASLSTGCAVPEFEAQAGYARLALDGDLGYADTATSTTIRQDIGSAFGLGDSQGAPYVRAMLDTGVQVLSVSAFDFHDDGTGTLQANFGNNPLLTAGAPVRSEFDLISAKAAYAFEIGFGPVSVSPGIALDYIDLDVSVRDLIGIAEERVELNAPIPLAFLRGELDLDVVSAVVETGYMAVNVEDVDGSLFDVEAMVVGHPTSLLELFVGYRLLNLKVDGRIDNDDFDADIRLGGFFLGGGLRF